MASEHLSGVLQLGSLTITVHTLKPPPAPTTYTHPWAEPGNQQADSTNHKTQTHYLMMPCVKAGHWAGKAVTSSTITSFLEAKWQHWMIGKQVCLSFEFIDTSLSGKIQPKLLKAVRLRNSIITKAIITTNMKMSSVLGSFYPLD